MPFIMIQQDIDAGTPCNPYACPIANTITRTLPGAEVVVKASFIYINGRHYPTPANVAEWIDGYDDGLERPLISFELPVEVRS